MTDVLTRSTEIPAPPTPSLNDPFAGGPQARAHIPAAATPVVRGLQPAQPPAAAGADGRRHALWFFWGWLLFATVVSIGGNVIHAWMTAPAPHLRLLAAIAAAVPPAVLLGSTHSVALLIKTRRRGYRRVDAAVLGAGMALTCCVAACAFALSFFSLRDLMIKLGVSADSAWLWPVAVDLSLICSTLALLALTSPATQRVMAAVGSAVLTSAEEVVAAVNNIGPRAATERHLWWESIAHTVRENNNGIRKIAEMTIGELAAVLERIFDEGESGRVIADSTSLHHREIRIIKETVADILDQSGVSAA